MRVKEVCGGEELCCDGGDIALPSATPFVRVENAGVNHGEGERTFFAWGSIACGTSGVISRSQVLGAENLRGYSMQSS